jgi:hypothetical protein
VITKDNKNVFLLPLDIQYIRPSSNGVPNLFKKTASELHGAGGFVQNSVHGKGYLLKPKVPSADLLVKSWIPPSGP